MTDKLIHSNQFIDKLNLCKSALSERRSLPFECYWEESIHSQEVADIFSDQWIGLGRADRLHNVGEYETLEICGQSLFLIRDQQHTLRLYANTCRHRGAQLLKDEGRCLAISCPFHGWTYALDGCLKGAKTMSENDHFDFSEYSLFEYKLKEMSGFLFAFLGGTALSLERQFGDFKKLHAPWSLDSLVTTRRQDFDVNCNWKAFLDVFNEYYHLDFVHPSSIGNLYLKPEVQDSTIGDFASQFGRTSGTGALLESEQQSTLPMIDGLVEPWSLGARYTWVFPNMAFAAGKEAVWLYEAYPINPNRCHVKQSICFPQSTTKLADFEEKSQAYYQRLDAAMDEDITALENQQQGLRNSPPLQGRFSKLMEANVASFVNWYATKLTET